jgi:hypothetical protein
MKESGKDCRLKKGRPIRYSKTRGFPMTRFLSRQLSRLWPIFVFAGLVIALSVALAEEGSDAPAVNPDTPAEGFRPVGIQPAIVQQVDQTRTPAEAPAEQDQTPPATSPDDHQ